MSAPENPAAFPAVGHGDFGDEGVLLQPGMTLRDWFAGQAPEPDESEITTQRGIDHNRNPHNDSYKPPIRSLDEIKADLRYRFAEAMLAERAKVQP